LLLLRHETNPFLKTAVIILNWNGLGLLQKFLPGVVETCSGIATVIVADNASTDSSVSWIQDNFKEVVIIKNATNEGFAKGYNTALRQVTAEYLLLLNSDVEVTPGWLQPLIRHLDENPGTAVVQPKIRWYKHREQFEYAGACGGYIDSFGYPFCRGRIFGDVENDHQQYESTIPVFWATGACMLIRSDVFRQVAGFDPVFFAHMEEIDLCWRIRNAGHEIMCLPESVVYHVGGATLPKNNPGKTLLNFRNNLSMLYKNLPGLKIFPVLLMRLILDGIAGIKFLAEGHGADCLAVIKAHFQFYGLILTGKIRRNNLPVIKKHSTIYPGLIVIDYYLLKKKKFSNLDFHPGKLNPS
jgi:GT2 family glycosyltransferase